MSSPKLPALLRGLESADAASRLAAAKSIGNAAVDGEDGAPAVLPLSRAMGDGDPKVREAAAWALSGFAVGGTDVSPAWGVLLGAVRSGTDDVRHWASVALSGVARGVEAGKLEAFLLEEIGALKTAGRKAFLATLRASATDIYFALAPMAALAEDGDTTVREWAIETIKDVALASSPAVAKLGELLGTSLADGASAGLARVAYRNGSVAPAVAALERSAAADGPAGTGTALAWHHLRSPERLAALLRTAGREPLAAAIRFLNRPETPEATLAALVPALEPLLKHKGKQVREEAAQALATVAIRRRDDAGLEALVRHRNPEVKKRAEVTVERLKVAAK